MLYNCLDVEERDHVIIAKLTRNKFADDEQLKQILKAELFSLNSSVLIVDFSRVEFISSAHFITFINLKSETTKMERALILCGMKPEIYEVFCAARMNEVCTIVPALASLAVAS